MLINKRIKYIFILVFLIAILTLTSCKKETKDIIEFKHINLNVYESNSLLYHNEGNYINPNEYIVEDKETVYQLYQAVSCDFYDNFDECYSVARNRTGYHRFFNSYIWYDSPVEYNRGFYFQVEKDEKYSYEFCHTNGKILSAKLYPSRSIPSKKYNTITYNPFYLPIDKHESYALYSSAGFDNQFLDIIVKEDGHIIGFSEVRFFIALNDEIIVWQAEIIASKAFPKIDDKYQDISYDLVAKLISEARKPYLN